MGKPLYLIFRYVCSELVQTLVCFLTTTTGEPRGSHSAKTPHLPQHPQRYRNQESLFLHSAYAVFCGVETRKPQENPGSSGHLGKPGIPGVSPPYLKSVGGQDLGLGSLRAAGPRQQRALVRCPA